MDVVERYKWTRKGMIKAQMGTWVNVPVDESMITKEPSLDSILESVASFMHLSPDDIKGKSRRRECCDARHLFFKVSRDVTQNSQLKIGRFLSRDHATVIHSCYQVERVTELTTLYKRYMGIDVPVKEEPSFKPPKELPKVDVVLPPSETIAVRESKYSHIYPANGREYSGYRVHSL